MLHVVKINNLYKEIIIPVNESISADMLLDKYGIVADVEIVGQSGGGSDLTFPYKLFHSFFSLFIPSKGMDKVMDKVTEDKEEDMVTEDKEEDMVTEDKEEDKDKVKVMVTKDDEVMDKVMVTKDEDEEGVNTIDSKKVMKITIKSINGLRPW